MKSNRPEVRVSHGDIVPFKRPRKPVISPSDRKRQKDSLKITYVGGGDDIA